jgi:hypothetical protein
MELTLSVKSFPGSSHAGHLRLSAEFAFGADFAGHARHFGGEGVQLIHHRIDGVFEFENFAFDGTVILRERSPLATPWSLPRCCGPGRSDCRPWS